MPGENDEGQQGQRTPRAKHKHSRSAAGPVSDSEGLQQVQKGSNQKRGGGRRTQQARNAPQPAWQDSAPSPAEGYFDAQGNFVSSGSYQNGQVQRGQVLGMFYLSDGAHVQGHQGKKKGNKHGKNARHLQGSNTPPHANSDNDQALSAAMAHNMTPAKAAAYAGPTFHASPAANALPIPKFFSKSVPNEAPKTGLQARLEQEPEKSDNSDKSDSPPAVQAVASVPVPERANESPLDFLFKADKEQKAKRQSAGLTLTPPAKKSDSSGIQPPLASPWQSIYGTGPRNHQRQPSNGSGRDMFMMEIDGREASPRPKHVSPPPPLPRLPNRSSSDQYGIPQLSPQATFNNRPQSSGYYPQSHNGPPMHSMQQQRPAMDHSFSPFNRSGPYPTPRSEETTPVAQQQSAYPPQNGLHYGNRNLSPLFKAAKQDPTRPPSNLRQELHHGQVGMAELPDSSPSRPNPHRQASTEAEKAALAYLQTQIPNRQAMPALPLPPAKPQGPTELEGTGAAPARTGVTPPGVNAFNAKSIEDDLKRMLKLTGGMK